MTPAGGTPLSFVKSHGLGNDFVIVDLRRAENRGVEIDAALARFLCDRRLGVGADQLLVLREPRTTAAVVRMDVWNTDGSRAEMCGNGIRAIALELGDAAPVGRAVRVETDAGLKQIERLADGRIRVNMGAPQIGAHGEDLVWPVDSKRGAGRLPAIHFTEVSMGNPHAVIFVEDVNLIPLEEWGRAVEVHARFPKRTNVEFVQMVSPARALVRVWERGAGATLACGTGACAVGVATAITARAGSGVPIEVVLPGGTLTIEWAGAGQPVWMTGPAVRVFTGRLP